MDSLVAAGSPGKATASRRTPALRVMRGVPRAPIGVAHGHRDIRRLRVGEDHGRTTRQVSWSGRGTLLVAEKGGDDLAIAQSHGCPKRLAARLRSQPMMDGRQVPHLHESDEIPRNILVKKRGPETAADVERPIWKRAPTR